MNTLEIVVQTGHRLLDDGAEFVEIVRFGRLYGWRTYKVRALLDGALEEVCGFATLEKAVDAFSAIYPETVWSRQVLPVRMLLARRRKNPTLVVKIGLVIAGDRCRAFEIRKLDNGFRCSIWPEASENEAPVHTNVYRCVEHAIEACLAR